MEEGSVMTYAIIDGEGYYVTFGHSNLNKTIHRAKEYLLIEADTKKTSYSTTIIRENSPKGPEKTVVSITLKTDWEVTRL